jgi:N-acetyl-anhydromuramyl-L-alanine amidase AmpD
MAQMPIGIKPKCSFICASYDRKKIATIPDLGLGEKDDNFHEVKKCLQQYNYLGEYSPHSQDTLDESTTSALERFQQRYNIPESGVLDHDTKEAMANLVVPCQI